MPVDRPLSRAARSARRALELRCPRCGQGPLFAGWFAMAGACARCGLSFERAQGYFVGAIYINYGVTTALALGGAFLLWAWTDLWVGWQLVLWGLFALLFPLWFFRWSRSLWLAIEYFVNPEH